MFKREPGGDIKTALYYFTYDKLASITIIFYKNTDFQPIVEELTAVNGQPVIKTQKPGAEITAWQRDNSIINLSKAPVETPLYLPEGRTEKVEKGEILLVINQQIDQFGYAWYFTFLAIISAYAINITGIIKMKSTREKLNSFLRSYQDLMLLKKTLKINVMLAILLVSIFLVYVGIFVYLFFAQDMRLSSITEHGFAFGVLTLPAGFITKRFEKPLKTLTVQSDDPVVKENYERIIKAWGKPGFKIPD